MAENVEPMKHAPEQAGGLIPSTPQPTKIAGSEPPNDESQRDRRRREWHTAKIERRKEEQRLKRKTKSAGCGPCPPGAETHNAPPSAYHDHAAGLESSRPHNRTPSQWKTILELHLCAGCLTRTIPPHKPSDKRAPCKGCPSVPYEEADISAIRKEIARQEVVARRKGNAKCMLAQSDGRRQQRQPARSLTHRDKSIPHPDPEHNVQYGYLDRSQHAGPRPNEVDVQPLYNFRDPSSFTPYYAEASLPRRPKAYPDIMSQSSGTLGQQVWAESMPEEPGELQILSLIETRPVASPKPSQELDISMMGMTPTTPSLSGAPEIHIEGEMKHTGVASPRIRVIPNADIGTLLPPISNEDRDWDSVTNVAEGLEQKGLQSTVVGDPSSSKLLVEMLLGEANARFISAERSWTLQGLRPSPNRSEWDDATMVEEPQELSPEFHSFYDKVLRSAQSAESFFATRQGTF